MRVDTTKEFRKISKAVQEQGYYCGYATFWNSNVLTEISNGKVDMYCCAYVNQINKGKIYEWLQLTSHKNQYPKGKVFILLRTDTDEFELYPYKEKLKEENIIYKSKKYKQILNVN